MDQRRKRRPTATPLVGADRYATSVAVAKQFFAAPTTAGLANGQTFPDALAGDVDNGHLGAPMLLVGSTALPASVRAYLSGTATIKSLNVYGGTTAVANSRHECGDGRYLGEHVGQRSNPVERLHYPVCQGRLRQPAETIARRVRVEHDRLQLA